MYLRREEQRALKRDKPVKIWRFHEPAASAPGRRYTSNGIIYTLLNKHEMRPADILRTQGKSVYEALRVAWPEQISTAWLLVIIKGDYTDQIRLLQPSTRREDYTEEPHRAMVGEPEAISAQENAAYAQQARDLRTEQLRDLGETNVEQIDRQLKNPGLRREERKRLRYARYILKRLDK